MLNQFQEACGRVYFPAIPVDQEEVLPARLSQLCGLLLVPYGAPGPTSWVSKADVEATADNTVTDNSKAKWVTGKGGIETPEDVVVEIGKDERFVSRRLYTLNFEINLKCTQHLSLIQRLQSRYPWFRLWAATKGGRFIGGPSGIVPKFVTASAPYGAGRDDLERGDITIQWFADIDPLATNMSGLFTNVSGDSPTPIANVMFYQQAFAAAATSALTWTENSGVLPTSNTAAQILVFQNGQKLEETVQYTISHLTAPAESTITIGALTHYPGANYEVLAVVTS